MFRDIQIHDSSDRLLKTTPISVMRNLIRSLFVRHLWVEGEKERSCSTCGRVERIDEESLDWGHVEWHLITRGDSTLH